MAVVSAELVCGGNESEGEGDLDRTVSGDEGETDEGVAVRSERGEDGMRVVFLAGVSMVERWWKSLASRTRRGFRRGNWVGVDAARWYKGTGTWRKGGSGSDLEFISERREAPARADFKVAPAGLGAELCPSFRLLCCAGLFFAGPIVLVAGSCRSIVQGGRGGV